MKLHHEYQRINVVLTKLEMPVDDQEQRSRNTCVLIHELNITNDDFDNKYKYKGNSTISYAWTDKTSTKPK